PRPRTSVGLRNNDSRRAFPSISHDIPLLANAKFRLALPCQGNSLFPWDTPLGHIYYTVDSFRRSCTATERDEEPVRRALFGLIPIAVR
uniref:Uncharacterized protein n=1 Tax=Cyprinus carpio carpio TaxID=630221 RepID=A0A8C1DLC4_CYPCA